MYIISDIIDKLNEIYLPSLQEPYDNSGIQVGYTNQPLTSALFTTDITEATIDEAIGVGANLVISHHPLIFHGLKHLTNATYIERTIIKAIKHNIVLFSIHTNADKVVGGVSYRMAQKIGLIDTQTLIPETNNNDGLGCIGILPTAEDELNFLNRLKNIFSTRCIRHSSLLNHSIQKVALCGGSGAEFINEVIKQKADIYITADVKYHDFFSAENKIVIADIGHFESEHFTKEVFCEQLIKYFPNFVCLMADTDVNPVFYI